MEETVGEASEVGAVGSVVDEVGLVAATGSADRGTTMAEVEVEVGLAEVTGEFRYVLPLRFGMF